MRRELGNEGRYWGMRSDLGKCDVMWAKKTQTLKSAFECHLVAKPCCQMWWDEFVLRCYIY